MDWTDFCKNKPSTRFKLALVHLPLTELEVRRALVEAACLKHQVDPNKVIDIVGADQPLALNMPFEFQPLRIIIVGEVV